MEFFVISLHHELDFRVSRPRQFLFSVAVQSPQVNQSAEKMFELIPKHSFTEDRKQPTGGATLLSIFYIFMHSGRVTVVVTTTLCVEQKLIFLTENQYKTSNLSKQTTISVRLYKMPPLNFFKRPPDGL